MTCKELVAVLKYAKQSKSYTLIFLDLKFLLIGIRRGGLDDDHHDNPRRDSSRDIPLSSVENKKPAEGPLQQTVTASGTYSSYKTAEDRAAFIKQQAEQRMAERLAALGLKPPIKSGESNQQRQERETKERQQRLRQAEAEDAKREQERQQRLADEQPIPHIATNTTSKKPPPPPARKTRFDSSGLHTGSKAKADDAVVSTDVDQKEREQLIIEKQQAQEAQVKAVELVHLIFYDY